MSILVRVLPFWISGIVISWFCTDSCTMNPVWIALVWTGVALVCIVVIPGTTGTLPPVSVLISILVFITSFSITFIKTGKANLPVEQPIRILGEIIKVWDGERSSRLKIRVFKYSLNEFTANSGEMILLISGRIPEANLDAGRKIICDIRLEKFTLRNDPGDFPERLYWSGEGIRKMAWIKSWEFADSKSFVDNRKPVVLAGKLQKYLCKHLDDSIVGSRQAGIMKAMLLGSRDDLPSEIKTVFQQTGISHLLAVSGLHVGLIYLIIIRLLFFMRRFRSVILVECIAVLAVWGYSVMTGFGPSVQRAAGMISLFALSRILDRRVEPIQVLIIALILQTAFDPFAIFRFGFQLSYLAVAGIFIAYGPWIKILKSKKIILKKIWNFAGVSIAAQSLTLPLILVYFHEFPMYFLLGNLVLVPIGLLAFYLSAIYLSLLSIGLSLDIVGKIIDFIIRIMIGAGEGIANFPYSMVGFESFAPIHILAYYFFVVVLFFENRLSILIKIKCILYFMLGFSLLDLLIGF